MLRGMRAACTAAVVVGALFVAGVGLVERSTAFLDGAQRPSMDAGPRALGHGSELTALRTSRSRTFVGANGRGRVTQVYSDPIHYRDGGTWRAIDNSLRRDGAGIANGENRFDLTLPERLANAPARLTADGDSISFRLVGAADARADVEGSSATYDDVGPGVALEYQATANGVKETIVLDSARAPSRFRFALGLSAGLQPRLRRDGRIDIVERGARRFVVPAPWMVDSAASPAVSRAVAYELAATGPGRWELIVSADRDWLAARGRVWPVRIDPSVQLPVDVDSDCEINAEEPESAAGCEAESLRVGVLDAPDPYDSYEYRALLRFDVAAAVPARSVVLNARLRLHGKEVDGTDPQTSTEIGVHRVLTAWDYWASWWWPRDGFPSDGWSQPGGDYDPTPLDTAIANGNGPTDWYVTEQVQRWVDGKEPNYGLGLVKAPFYQAGLGIEAFASAEDGVLAAPSLEIAYEPRAGDSPPYTLTGVRVDDRVMAGVNVAGGNLTVRADDLAIDETFAGRFARYYNSAWDGVNVGAFGAGGTASVGFDARPQVFGDGSVGLYLGNGSAFPFKRVGSSFQTPPGVQGTLAYEGSDLVYTDGDGMRWIWPPYSPGVTRIEKGADALTLEYDVFGGLARIVEDGAAITVESDAARSIRSTDRADGSRFEYRYGLNDDGDRVTTVVRDDGEQSEYVHDAVTGLITRATGAGGKVVEFGYDAQERVTSVTEDPNGTPRLTAFAYQAVSAPCSAATDAGKTVVTRPGGSQSIYCHREDLAVTATVHSPQADTSAPDLEISGPLYDNRVGGPAPAQAPLGPREYRSDLTIDVTDGGRWPAGDLERHSGVDTVRVQRLLTYDANVACTSTSAWLWQTLHDFGANPTAGPAAAWREIGFDLDPTTLAPGLHRFRVVALDRAGNRSVRCLDFTISHSAPQLTLTSELSSGTATQDVHGIDATITGTGLRYVRYYVDGELESTDRFEVDPATGDWPTVWTGPVGPFDARPEEGVTPGTHTVRVEAVNARLVKTAATLTFTVQANSEPPPGETAAIHNAKVGFYERYHDVSPATAAQHVAVQEQVEAADVDDVVDVIGAATYAGMYYDPGDGGKLKIGVKTPEGSQPSGPAVQAAEDLLSARGIAAETDIVPKEHSFAELMAEKAEIDEDLAEEIAAGEIETGIDFELNRVEIEVANDVPSLTAQRADSAADDSAVNTEVVAGDAPTASVDLTADCNTASDIVRCKRPLRGGVAIRSVRGNLVLRCTAGVVMESNDVERNGTRKLYLLTAGHCVHHGRRGGTWQAYSNDGFPVETNTFGRGWRSNFNEKGDTGIIQINTRRGSYGRRPRNWNVVTAVDDLEYNTTRNFRYRIRHTATSWEPHDKQKLVLCSTSGPTRQGNDHFTDCGTVEDVAKTVTSNDHITGEKHTVTDAAQINGMCALGGTSGAAVFVDHKVYGILFSARTITNEEGENCRSYYEGMRRAMNDLNVHLYRP